MSRQKTFQWDQNATTGSDEPISRSQRKRESTAQQILGEKLTALSDAELDRLPLSPDLRGAILHWRSISAHEGRRRQTQYIGRLMREENDEHAIASALEDLENRHSSENLAFKHLEMLREKLMLASPAELDVLLTPYGEAAKDLRKLVESARNERTHGRPPRDYRVLFRRLKEL